jgi:tetratricopeptide (TPR) repeat protein
MDRDPSFPLCRTQSILLASGEISMRHRFALVAITALAACATGSAITPPILTLSSLSEVTADSLLALNALCSADAVSERTIAPDLKLATGMGTGGFKVDTANAEAQQWFNYGLALSHAFYHQDVKAAMKRSVELDPSCSLCSWGEAWALGPTLNYGISDDERKLALAAAERAQSLAKPGDTLARQLADAMVARYAEPKPKPADATTKATGAKAGESDASAEDEGTEPAFAQALAAIAADTYAEHPELTVLAAHSLMMASTEEKRDDLKSALVLLEKVLKDHPDDTGAIHYYIHATEFDDRAEDALAYARRLGDLAPNASHLVHMPAHTFFRAGLYQEAAVANAKAIATDVSWIAEGGDARPPMLKDFRLPMYYSHNLAFGLAGAMMSGDGELALRYADHATKAYPDVGAKQRFDPTPRTYVALARYAPDRMLALAPSSRDEDYFRAYHAYGRGEALLQKGDAAGARVEIRKLRKLVKDDAEAKIALAVLEGRLAMAEGNTRAAVDRFSAGAKIQEDEFGTWMDPPDWWYPLRRSLAAAHLKAGDFAKAEAEASASLKTWKHDPLALWVLGIAMLNQGRTTEGEETLARARSLWRGDFHSITVEAI